MVDCVRHAVIDYYRLGLKETTQYYWEFASALLMVDCVRDAVISLETSLLVLSYF